MGTDVRMRRLGMLGWLWLILNMIGGIWLGLRIVVKVGLVRMLMREGCKVGAYKRSLYNSS